MSNPSHIDPAATFVPPSDTQMIKQQAITGVGGYRQGIPEGDQALCTNQDTSIGSTDKAGGNGATQAGIPIGTPLKEACISASALQVLNQAKLRPALKNKCVLLLAYLTRIHLRRRQPRRYINVHSGTLVEMLTRRGYLEAIRTLAKLGLIIVNKHYWVWTYSKSFRVNPSYLQDIIIHPFEVPDRAHEEPNLELQPFLPRVELSEAGKLYFQKRYGRLSNPWKMACWRENYGALVGKRLWTAVDPKTGRVFHNITSLPSFLRRYLRLAGEETVEIDIRNSQPFFAAALYPVSSPERDRFVASVVSGTFYELLNAKLSKGVADRQQLKRLVFRQVLFGRLRTNDQREGWRAFATEFPQLATIIRAIKQAEGYNAVALRLQSLESEAVISGLMAECAVAGIPVLTVHDSIICRRADGDRIEKLIAKHCKRVVGIEPSLKRTVMSDGQS